MCCTCGTHFATFPRRPLRKNNSKLQTFTFWIATFRKQHYGFTFLFLLRQYTSRTVLRQISSVDVREAWLKVILKELYWDQVSTVVHACNTILACFVWSWSSSVLIKPFRSLNLNVQLIHVISLNLHALSRIGVKLWNDNILENDDSYIRICHTKSLIILFIFNCMSLLPNPVLSKLLRSCYVVLIKQCFF